MPCDRRGFVRIGAGALVAAMVPGCASLMARRVPLVNGTVEVDLRQYPELAEPGGAVRLLPDGWQEPFVLLANRDGHLVALSPICTHLQCVVEVNPDRLTCPCHGSAFDREGRVLQGPAAAPLRRYATREPGPGVLVIQVEERR